MLIANWVKSAILSLVFDYLYDKLIDVIDKYAEGTENEIDDSVVDWLYEMKEIVRDQVKGL